APSRSRYLWSAGTSDQRFFTGWLSRFDCPGLHWSAGRTSAFPSLEPTGTDCLEFRFNELPDRLVDYRCRAVRGRHQLADTAATAAMMANGFIGAVRAGTRENPVARRKNLSK